MRGPGNGKATYAELQKKRETRVPPLWADWGVRGGRRSKRNRERSGGGLAHKLLETR